MPNSEDPLPSSSKKNFIKKKLNGDQLVYIFNMSEDVWPFIQAMNDEKAREFEINENSNLSDRELFTLAKESHPIYICPKQVKPDFLAYVADLIKIKDLKIFVPRHHSGEISKDVLADTKLFSQLVKIGLGVRRLLLVPYSTTFQFLELVEALRSAGVDVFTPESPDEEDAWTVNFFGSKSGIRQLVQKSKILEPDLVMPDGLICVSRIDAARIAANKYLKERGVLLKTNKGHSGAGILIFRDGDLPSTYKACEQAILRELKKDVYWEMFPIVIESLINVDISVGGGFPNVEFKIKRNGEIEFLYFCGLRVTKDGVFRGVEMNENVLHDRLETRLIDTGFFVGEQYRSAGYRGFFDVDFVAGKNGEIYVTESNTRRTGGTFSYQAASFLIGKDFLKDSYCLVDMGYKLESSYRHFEFSDFYQALKPILFNKKTKEGVVIAAANIIKQGQFGYMVFGKNKNSASKIEIKLKKLISQMVE